jgi:hypothetical protein
MLMVGCDGKCELGWATVVDEILKMGSSYGANVLLPSPPLAATDWNREDKGPYKSCWEGVPGSILFWCGRKVGLSVQSRR